MQRYAILDSTNAVQSVALWDGVTAWHPGDGLTVVPDPGAQAQVGGVYANGVFGSAPAPAPEVPDSVTRFQAFAALMQAGRLTQVQTYMQTAPALTQLAWNEAVTFERGSNLLESLGTQLGMTSAQIDALFIAASQIKV